MFKQLGIKASKFEIDRILEKHDRNKDGHLNKEEFEDVRITLKKKFRFEYLRRFI